MVKNFVRIGYNSEALDSKQWTFAGSTQPYIKANVRVSPVIYVRALVIFMSIMDTLDKKLTMLRF